MTPTTSLVANGPTFIAYVGVFALSAVACFSGLRRIPRIEDKDTRRGLGALLVLSGGWAAAHVGFLVVPSTDLKLVLYLIGLFFGFATIGAWLYFCSAYTGRSFHSDPTYRRLAIAVYLLVVAVKVTNPIHGLYFTAEPVSTPFAHLAIQHHVLHWLAMGLAYALAAVGYFMLFELFTQTGYGTKPLVGLVGLTGLPVVLDVAGLISPLLLDMTYEPIGVAAFAVGVMFVYFDRFQSVQLAGDIDNPVVFVDEEGEIRDANWRARQLFPALDDAVGRPLEETLPPVHERLGDEDSVITVDDFGETRYYKVSTNPFTQGHTAVGMMILLDDVTREESHRREIERKNERLNEFASIVSHDLRNPLAVAKGRLDLERDAGDSEDLAAVAEALERMESLIEDVLTLARQGQDIGETETVSLSTIAERSWSTVDADDAQLVLEGDMEFLADSDRLRQLLENLFRNAVEHSSTSSRTHSDDAVEHGGSGVTVTVGAIGEDGFYVEDDGPGIPSDDREQVFEHGFTSSATGTGFGLSIVGAIADAHGWKVEVTDADSGGARFEFAGIERLG